ncbi:hypothetical protein ABZ672_37800, partial [Streptomyces mirabilis]
MSWQNGETEAEPRVYLPSGDGEAPPAYEAYADPAAAHGWQDAYGGAGADGGPGVRTADGDGPGAGGEGDGAFSAQHTLRRSWGLGWQSVLRELARVGAA